MLIVVGKIGNSKFNNFKTRFNMTRIKGLFGRVYGITSAHRL